VPILLTTHKKIQCGFDGISCKKAQRSSILKALTLNKVENRTFESGKVYNAPSGVMIAPYWA